VAELGAASVAMSVAGAFMREGVFRTRGSFFERQQAQVPQKVASTRSSGLGGLA
jgi:hypothetical protein